MTTEQFNVLREAVLNTLHYGLPEQALGMLQGACCVTNVSVAQSDDLDQLFAWVNMAGTCAIDRKFDDAQMQEWHDTQVSLEESVR